MTSSAIQFPITTVSTDTAALREIAWTLSSFGYQVDSSSDWSENAPWQHIDTPSLLILDARDEAEIQAVFATTRTTPFVYRIAFYDANSLASSDQLKDLGADDLVRFPVNIGELLSRIKSGCRRLEFERRLSMTTRFEKQSRIANRTSLIRQLERQLRDSQDGALVVLGIDALERLRTQHGSHATAEASTRLAHCLHAELTKEDTCGILAEGVFAILLQGCSVADGIEFAEDISKKLQGQSSLSGVVLNWPSGETATQTIERGVATLDHLRAFGGSRILDANEVEQIHSNWKQKFPPYHEVFAHHVMEALPLVLPANGHRPSDSQSLGIYAFATGQTVPPCVPVVDEAGFLLGIIEANTLQQGGNDVFQSLEEHLVPTEATINGDVRLDQIISTMASAEKDYLVVVENNKPIGYITYENIVAMAVDPIGDQPDIQPELVGASMNSLVIPLS